MADSREKERQAALRTLLDTVMFRDLFTLAHVPIIRAWKRRLYREVSLPIEQRIGLQHALLALHEGFEAVFKAAGAELPEYIEEEFDLQDEH